MRSTLKITSAMKLVASSKLRKAQRAIEMLRPYELELESIALSVGTSLEEKSSGKVAVVALSSNSSLCGGFNVGVIKKAQEVLRECPGARVYCLGRKMFEAMRKTEDAVDRSDLVGRTSYEAVASLAGEIVSLYNSGEFSKVVLVYNHFVSTSKQVPTVETYLPFELKAVSSDAGELEDDFIMEPGAEEIGSILLPKVLSLKLYAAVLDSVASEHAARTVAMQTATDNAQDLLGDLTLEYNKGRQQKITAEILDLLGGAAK